MGLPISPGEYSRWLPPSSSAQRGAAGGHSPSIAYFMSCAKRFHITSALIFPTFSSWGNLGQGGSVGARCSEREKEPP